MKKIQPLTLLFLLLGLHYQGFTTILHVPAICGSIQAGIDASVDGDIVLVEPNTYYESINLSGKNIILCSKYFTTGNSSFIASTIIDGSNSGRVITVNNGENSSCRIIGFTIQHGNSSSEVGLTYGGGIFISDASPQILNCIIQNNTASENGGGLALNGLSTSAKVINCTIQNNTAGSFGGGVFMGDCTSDAEIISCIISGNVNTCNNCDFNGGGGGVNIYHSGKLTDCLIINNSAPNAVVGGGGVYCDWGDYYGSQNIYINGCTIANNTAMNFGGTANVIDGGEFDNCIIWGNTDNLSNPSNWDGSTFNNCCTDPLPGGNGNIDSDPLFISSLTGNFRLSAGSPCIDAGDNTYNTQLTDLDGNPRIINSTIDMGAYEYGSSGVIVQIGYDYNPTWEFPIYTCNSYNYSQEIYLGSEITDGGGSAGFITKIRFYYTGDAAVFSNWNNWSVYLGNTSKTEFTSTTDWVPFGSMKQVFSGIIPVPVAGNWVELSLQNPFYYSGDNIVVAVDEPVNGYDCTAHWGSFFSGAARGLLYASNNFNPDPALPPAANNGPDYWIAQVQFDINTAFGTLEGNITELPGCTVPIEGATITTGAFSTVSDVSGHYQFNLPVGTYYNVTAAYHDATQTISSVDINQGSTVIQNFCLEPYFAPPVFLQAKVNGPLQNNVHLTWLAPGLMGDQWIHWDDGTITGALGYGAPATFDVASRWPVSDIAPYNGTYLKKIRFVPQEVTSTYTLKVWKGPGASTLLYSQVVANPYIGTWNEITLTTPVLIDGTDEFWFGYEIYQPLNGYPAGLAPGPAVAGKGDMLGSPGGEWFSLNQQWGWQFNWALQGFVSESPIVLQPLDPIVQNTSPQPAMNPQGQADAKPQIKLLDKPVTSEFSSVAPSKDEKLQGSSGTNPLVPLATFTGYNVYRNNVNIASNIPGLSYDDLALPKGGYDYQVSAQYSTGESVLIGPVHVDIYTCFPPTNLTVSNTTLTTTTANLSWTPSTISAIHQWDFEWGTAGYPQGFGTNVFISGTPSYAFTNLAPGTEYDVYIRTHCSVSDQSAWVKKTFRTHYFDCPAGAVAEGEACGSSVNNGCEQVPTANGIITCGETICGTAWLHRSHRDSDWYSFTLSVTTDVTLSGNSEFTGYFALASAPCLSSQINNANIGPGYAFQYTTQLNAGTYYVGVTPSYAEQVACDSLDRYWVKITCNTCLTPTALNAINITSDAADLAWTSNAVKWNIEWGAFGFTQGSGNMITGTTTNPYHLSGLIMGHAYSYYVQADCGGGHFSNWAGPYTFFLPCPAVTLPYAEDFTTQFVGATPQCWHVLGAGTPPNWIVNFSNNAGGSSPELTFLNYPWAYSATEILSPLINTTGSTELNLSFKQYINAYNSGSPCEVWTTSNGGVTWHPVWSVTPVGIVGPETINVTISNTDVGSATFQFAFVVNGASFNLGLWDIDDIALTVSSATKTLNLKVYIEGLYAGGGTMNQAYDDLGPHFGPGIADKVTVELHNNGTYANVVYTSGLVDLSTSGNIAINTIPAGLSGSYYITIRHRNSIETTTALPVSFAASTVSYDFSTAATKAYGDNLKPMGSVYAIWSGDVNQDGIIDTDDQNPVENASTLATMGYIVEDVNGDGLVDTSDMNIVENNSTTGIMAITP